MKHAPELQAAAAAARSAGDILRDLRGRFLNVREKPDRTLLTDADLAAEAEILDRLRRAFPEDALLSEEAGATGPSSERQWIVDPLDGTTNYSRGLPYFAVSIALWEGGAPAVAVVYLPVLDEMFTATRNGAATLNGEEIRVSHTGAVREAMINVYFDRHERLEAGLEVFRRVALNCEGRVKIMGSTAGLLCYVACGRLDGFLRNATKLPDFAAGGLILQQAGGRLTDFDERPLSDTGQSLLATNGQIHAELARIIRHESREAQDVCR
jgi:myo-inositol-1(or 4)-monophosphatase